MRILVSILSVMLMVQSANAQALWRNFFTTNQNPIVDVVAGSNATVQASTIGVNQRRFTVNAVPTAGQTNFPLSSITNANHLTNWAFIPTNYVPPEAAHATNADYAAYATNAGSVTNLSTSLTNWIEELVANVNQHYYFSSVTNSLGVGVSTNCSTMIDAPVAAASTNSVAIPTAGVYFLSRVSTNTVTRIEEGPIHLQTYVYVSGGALVQSVTAHPEMWIWFTNDTMVQIATSGPQVFTETATPTIFNTTMNVATATNLTGGAHLLLRWYADAVANTPTWNFVIGGVYDSHISVNVPASSASINASQITGVLSPTQLATNTPAANQVLTATSAGSAAWKNFGAQYTGFWNYGTNIVISPTNGNLQNWTLTNTSWAALAYDTNYTETIRLNIYNSNTVTWTTSYLSNSANLGPSNRISVILLDHPQDTNLWWGYRLR